MSEERPAIDWREVSARLERVRLALESSREPPPEEARRVLRDRALALARPIEAASTPGVTQDLLVFSVDGERYGIETVSVLEAFRVGALAALPCAPPFVLGLAGHRGRVLPVLDLVRLLGLPGRAGPGSVVVAVEAGGMTFGILAGDVAGTVRVGVETLAPAPTRPEGGPSLVKGVTPEMVAVLDIEALVRDPRIVVDEEAG